jgi:hypothetical protein
MMCCGYPFERHEWCCGRPWGYFLPLMSIEEEVKTLEEYKEALEKQLEKVNKRLEALKK